MRSARSCRRRSRPSPAGRRSVATRPWRAAAARRARGGRGGRGGRAAGSLAGRMPRHQRSDHRWERAEGVFGRLSGPLVRPWFRAKQGAAHAGRKARHRTDAGLSPALLDPAESGSVAESAPWATERQSGPGDEQGQPTWPVRASPPCQGVDRARCWQPATVLIARPTGTSGCRSRRTRRCSQGRPARRACRGCTTRAG
jgi:hypothetical protein